LVGTKDGVQKAWTVRRRPEAERWDHDLVANMKGTPQRMSADLPGEERPVAVDVEPPEEGEPDELKPSRSGGRRQLYLKKNDFERYGYTEGCEGCRKMKLGRRAPYPHRRSCRDRLEDHIKENEEPRWERAALRGEPKSRRPADSLQDESRQSLAGDKDPGDSTARRDDPGTEDQRVEGDSTARRDSSDTEGCESAPAAGQYVGFNAGSLTERLMNADVTEVFSPHRVTVEAPKFGWKPSEAMDLTTGWDITRLEDN